MSIYTYPYKSRMTNYTYVFSVHLRYKITSSTTKEGAYHGFLSTYISRNCFNALISRLIYLLCSKCSATISRSFILADAATYRLTLTARDTPLAFPMS